MDSAQVERVRRALRRRRKPPWRLLWRGRPPAPWAEMRTRPRWRVRLRQLQAGWRLLWAERLRRDLDPIYRLVACRRGRHRDAHLLADDLIGSQLGNDYPGVGRLRGLRPGRRVAQGQAQARNPIAAQQAVQRVLSGKERTNQWQVRGRPEGREQGLCGFSGPAQDALQRWPSVAGCWLAVM